MRTLKTLLGVAFAAIAFSTAAQAGTTFTVKNTSAQRLFIWDDGNSNYQEIGGTDPNTVDLAMHPWSSYMSPWGNPRVSYTFVAGRAYTYDGTTMADTTVAGTAPAITSANTATFTQNQSGSFTVTASGSPTPTFSITGLPTGLTYDGTSGIISGTPTDAGTYTVSVTATNGTAPDATQSLSLTVQAASVDTSAINVSLTPGSLYLDPKGGTVTLTATISGYPAGTTTGLGFNATIPTGWTYQGGTNEPGVKPSTGNMGTLEWTWTSTPSSPASFSFTLSYPASATGTITSGAVLRVSGTPATKAAADVTTSAAAAPTITSGTTASGTYGQSFTYNITATSSISVTYGASGLPSGLSVHPDTGVIDGTPTQAGSFNATVTATNGSGTASQGVTITIAQATATVSLSGLSATFDASSHVASATTTPGGLTVTFTYDGSTTAPTNAGSYAVVGTISDTNYTGSASGTLVIAKKSVTVSPVTASRAYGSSNPSFAASYSGFAGSDNASVVSGTPVFTAAANATSAVGSYSVTTDASGLTASNYTFTGSNGSMSVTKAPLTVAADNLTRYVGLANPTLTYTITGYVNGENASAISGQPTLSTTATVDSVSGSYPISIAQGSLSATNYSFSFVPGTLTLDLGYATVDEDHNWRISQAELLRVIEIYNTVENSVRTGAYHSQNGSEDNFAPGSGTITGYHRTDDFNGGQDGKIDVIELTRVIELYNYVNPVTHQRTGQYHLDVNTEDFFATGP